MTEHTVPIPERHIKKLVHAFAAADEAQAKAEAAKREAQSKDIALQRANQNRANVMELVYELVGAPQTASVDFGAGVLRWQEEEKAAPVPPVPLGDAADGELSA
jgi:hypothetical protein